MQPQAVRRPAARRRRLGRRGAAVAELEVIGMEDPVAERRMLAALQALRPDDVGHAGGLNPDLGCDAGIEVGGAGEEPRFAGAVVAAALAIHGCGELARAMR